MDKEKLEQAMMEFCIRVLEGKGNVQETAILPELIGLMLDIHEK